MKSARPAALLLFLVFLALYCAWGTAGTFSFEEVSLFPNNNMLARAFVQGHLDIAEHPSTDVVEKDGKVYLYSGPLPAALRLPFALVGLDVPTGLAVALFLAGTLALLFVVLARFGPPGGRAGMALRLAFPAALGLSGYGLLMAAFPTFHHEAIAGAMFFLVAAFALYARFSAQGFFVSHGGIIAFALCLSAAPACRFSSSYAVGVLAAAFLVGLWKNRERLGAGRVQAQAAILAGLGALSLGALLAYNQARFGSPLDFGILLQTSVYNAYWQEHGFFRYDYLPFNLWNLFFRLPEVTGSFPYLHLPMYRLVCQASGPVPDALVNGNELSVSVFLLFPLAALFAVPLVALARGKMAEMRQMILVPAAMAALQVLAIASTVNTVARFYWDFLPLLLILAFAGAGFLVREKRVPVAAFLALAVASVLLSFPVAVQAVYEYTFWIRFRSPLFSWFF
ncbi:MAG: hypothetical protein KKA60_06430 [Proteobacteria bacterium]|nr:hypothetical protein [Pseudomonadota bacterium]